MRCAARPGLELQLGPACERGDEVGRVLDAAREQAHCIQRIRAGLHAAAGQRAKAGFVAGDAAVGCRAYHRTCGLSSKGEWKHVIGDTRGRTAR